MTAQDLKNSILQLAMQGKLVPQDPNDEPASELLKRIKAEKARLIKEGKIKREKTPRSIFEEDKPFEIPESWEWVRLSQIVYNYGQKVPNEEFCYIDVGSIDNYVGRLSETNTIIKPENAPSRARKVVKRGAILYSCVRPYLLNTCIVDREFSRPPIASTAFAVLMPTEGIYNKYLHLYLRSPSFVSYTNTSSTGQAYPAINDKRLYDAVIPVPPHEEQMRIVAKIEELLPLVERYDESEKRLLELNKKFPDELRKSILQQAVQGKLTEQDPHDEPASELLKRIKAEKARLIKEGKIKKEKPLAPISEEAIPFEIPSNWEWVRWGTLAESIQYGYNAPAQSSGRIKMVRISDIQNNSVNWETVPYCEIDEKNIDLYLLRSNDILFARTGGTVGKSFLVSVVPDKAIYAGYLIRTRYSTLLSSKFLKYFMESQLYWNQLRNGTIATAQPNCNGKTLGEMILPLPPAAEQERIVAIVEELFSVCDSLQ
jgi:type I restriction enzyme S subunit